MYYLIIILLILSGCVGRPAEIIEEPPIERVEPPIEIYDREIYDPYRYPEGRIIYDREIRVPERRRLERYRLEDRVR